MLRRLFWALGAWLLLVLVLAVLPVLCVRIGWPLPRAIPTWPELSGALRRPLPDGFTLRLLAVVGWVVWAQLLVAVAAEMRARRRNAWPRRVAPRRLQSLVAEIVAAATLTVGSTTAVASAAPHLAPASAVVAIVRSERHAQVGPPTTLRTSTAVVTGPASGAVTGAATLHSNNGRDVSLPATLAETTQGGYVVWPGYPAPTGPPAASAIATDAKYVVVNPGDSLWKLGQDHLGDGIRGEQIWTLNAGRTMDDGRVFTNSWLIEPGWRLVMPADATGCQVMGAAPAAASAPAAPAAPPDSPSAAPTRTPAPPAAGGADVSTNGHSAVPGPPMTLPVPTFPAARPAQRPNVSRAAQDGTAHDRPIPGWLVPWGAGGAATMLATWAAVEAARRRSRRLRKSRPGFVMPPTDPTVAPITVAVRAASDVDGVDRLQAALYHLATVADRRLRPVVALRHLDGRIDVQLFSAAEPIPPWTATDNLFWALDPEAELPDVDPLVMPCPALVQLGVCDDGAELYVDLEAVGLLGLTGTAETVRAVARALSATLVVSPTARLCRVLTLGFDPFGLDEHVEDRFVVARSVESLLHEAEMTAKDVVRGIDEADAGSSFRLRALDSDSGWEPAVAVMVGTALASDELARLERLAGDGGRGAAVVSSADGVKAAWTLELVDPVGGWWELNPLGQRVRPVQMAADELAELAAYLADADAEPVEAPTEPPPVTLSDPAVSTPSSATSGPGEIVSADHHAGDGSQVVATNGTDPDRSTAELFDAAVAPPDLAPMVTTVDEQATSAGGAPVYVEPDWLVMIRLFGPPSAVNRKGLVMGDGGRGAPLELLAWLVTHRETATRTGAKEALWGGEEVKSRTVSNVINLARTLLRDLADEPGEEFIGRHVERLPLYARVVSDYDLVADRLAFARRHQMQYPEAAAEALAGGLRLTRGVPLDGVRWLWADDNHLSSNVAIVGSSLATELAELRLQAGQTDLAIEATSVGLEVIPGNEELVRLRMQALIDSGDRRAAFKVYEKYEGVTAARNESVGPAIAELRNELLRQTRK